MEQLGAPPLCFSGSPKLYKQHIKNLSVDNCIFLRYENSKSPACPKIDDFWKIWIFQKFRYWAHRTSIPTGCGFKTTKHIKRTIFDTL